MATTNILNISVFNALLIGSGLVAADLWDIMMQPGESSEHDFDDILSFSSSSSSVPRVDLDNEDVISRINENDPDIKFLCTLSSSRHTLKEGWEKRASTALGNNTQLEKLIYFGLFAKYHVEDFCSGLAANRSIKTFVISGGDLSDDAFAKLAPFFVNNNNLSCITFYEYGNYELTSNNIRLLASALASRSNKSSLKQFSLENCNALGSGQASAELLAALHGYHNLGKVLLENSGCRGPGRRDCAIAIATMLQNSQCKLKKLSLSNTCPWSDWTSNHINDECTTILANAIANNSTLKSLRLCNQHHIGIIGLDSISLCLMRNTTLTMLDLSECRIGDMGLTVLGGARK